MDLTIVLRHPELRQLCSEFEAVIEDSLERLDYSRALDLAGQWLLRLDGGADDEQLAEQKALIRLWRVSNSFSFSDGTRPLKNWTLSFVGGAAGTTRDCCPEP